MSSNYPGTLDSFANPAPTDYEDVVSHSGQHSNANDAIESIEGVLGTTAGSALFANYGTADKPVKANSAGTLTQPLGLGTLTSGTVSITSIIDDDTMATASATTLATSESTKAYVDNGTWLKDSMSRQAIINGNFDVWQRGVSSTTAGGEYYTADRWFRYDSPGTGTLPTITTSRQQIGVGLIYGAFYNLRMTYAGASANLSSGAENSLGYKIEYGTRSLCGDGKKVTVSFWAKSDIANKRIGLWASQKYGTGGSPSSGENINGETFTLTSSWQKFTHTFTTNTLVGKTFGTANDDYFQLVFMGAWGSAFNTRNASATVEDISGAGFIDIAQVQLCAGDVALPFMPKSFEEELRACMRFTYGITTVSTNEAIGLGSSYSTTGTYIQIKLPVNMRTIPTLTATAGDWKLADFVGASLDVTAISILNTYQGTTSVILGVDVASGLTASRPYHLVGDGTAGRVLILSSEL